MSNKEVTISISENELALILAIVETRFPRHELAQKIKNDTASHTEMEVAFLISSLLNSYKQLENSKEENAV